MYKFRSILFLILFFVSALAFADKYCDNVFVRGKELYKKKEYSEAKKRFCLVLEECGSETYPDIKNWIKKCDDALKPKLTVNKNLIYSSAEGITTNVIVNSNVKWEIDKTEGEIYSVIRNKNVLTIKILKNETTLQRKNSFCVKTIDGAIVKKIEIEQSAMASSVIEKSENEELILDAAAEIVDSVLISVVEKENIDNVIEEYTIKIEKEYIDFNIKDVKFRMMLVEGDGLMYDGEEANLANYFIGETEVTQALWNVVMGTTIYEEKAKISAFKGKRLRMKVGGDNFPMCFISRSDAKRMCDTLNVILKDELPKGYKFSLPTRAQWMYAASGGNRSIGYLYAGSDFLNDVAWYGNKSRGSYIVKSKQPNELGLYDMSGNVSEWVKDFPLNCGGSWRTPKNGCTIMSHSFNGNGGFSNIGFRLSLSEETNDTVHQWVDLGLSVKWATCNIGAENPENFGDYFAWGEITTKNIYNYDTYKYKYYKDSNVFLTKYCTNNNLGIVDNKIILDMEDDVAHAIWGGNWRMPTDEEMLELQRECTWTITEKNGIYGYNIVGPNGNSIFLPLAGVMFNDKLINAGTSGYYWSKSLDIYHHSSAAYYLFFGTNAKVGNGCGRFDGLTIRPVCE